MKNFRKSIIALATVAAMLVPSVAMAATITKTVDGAVEGNVYAGFYTNDGVLVKADLGGTTEVKTETTTSGSTEEAELTQPAVSAKIVTANPIKEIKKLVFTATPDADMGVIAAASAIFSYDSTVVVPEADAFKFFEDPYSGNSIATNSSVATYADGDRVIVKAEGAVAGGGEFALNAAGVNVIEFSFTVAEGKEITADTFKIEDDYDANPVLAQVYGDRTSSTATGLFVGTSSDYVRYGAWDNGADTLTWNGFEVVAEPEIADTALVSVTDEFVGEGEAGAVHKLVFSVKAPEGTEAESTSLTFSFDRDVIEPVLNEDGVLFDEEYFLEDVVLDGGAFVTAQHAYRNATTVSAFKYDEDNSFAEMDDSICTITFATVKNRGNLVMDNNIMFTEFYYVVNDGAKVDENTFSFANAKFDDVAADFAGFPWKAAETTTTTTTTITIDVDAPESYDYIKLFVWDDKQIAKCDPIDVTLN